MLFKPAQLGLARLDPAELAADRKACKKIGPCGVGKKALYLNSFYIDRRYYLPYGSISRVFKRVAMSQGGFSGKGMFASMAYLVVEYDGGKQKQCNFKDERDVDKLLEVLAKEQPQIHLLSAAGEQMLQKKEAEKAEKLRAAGVQPQKKKAVGSKFFNDLAGLMGDEFMKRGATLHGCDVRTRDAFANMDIAGYNYGIYRYKHDLKKYPNRLILGSETFCNDAYRFREQAKKNPRLVGDFVWAGMDYLGEVGVGSWEYKAYATQFSGLGWTTAGSGRIDLNGRPLGEALYTRVALEQEIGPYIAVRPVMFSGEKHSPSAWKMTDAMPSWSWAGCEGKKAHIEVYARAAKVALLLNGKKVAEKQLKNDCLAKFTIPYQSGTLEAVSYDAIDRVLGRCKLQTAGTDTVLRAVPEEKKTKPGRLCYIRIRYTDRAGELKPMERGMVNITVSGGKLLAAGSACPFHPGSYLTPETDTYYGEALAVVEAGESGAVEVSISDGERSDTVKIPIA